ncbi:hypothetical protein [Azotobacter salinestris]|uniref:hypothetical protein n=1 Tax=Azotobacter salinestris TaxID=69964 RepID=UPI0032DF5AFC
MVILLKSESTENTITPTGEGVPREGEIKKSDQFVQRAAFGRDGTGVPFIPGSQIEPGLITAATQECRSFQRLPVHGLRGVGTRIPRALPMDGADALPECSAHEKAETKRKIHEVFPGKENGETLHPQGK